MTNVHKRVINRMRSGQQTKRILMKFAEDHGFVYFGHVDQHDDDHELIRGLTLSPRHRDRHYTVGTFEGYDIAMLERTDTITYPGKPDEKQNWFIMQFDLKNNKDLPHVFIGLKTHSPTFYSHLLTKFKVLQPVPLGTFGMYDAQFTQRYSVYTAPAEALNAERLFDQASTTLIAKHFGSLTLEVVDGYLYLYSNHRRTTSQLVTTMLQNGVWLSRHIDERAAHI